ncbi:TonB-dependent receptor [Spirosoma arcticum]
MLQIRSQTSLLLPLLCLLLVGGSFTQVRGQRAATLSGVVRGLDGVAVSGATIHLLTTKHGTVSDAQGLFSLPQLSPLTYTLVVSHVGYASVTEQLTLQPGQDYRLTLRLTPAMRELNTVSVLGQSDGELLRNSPQAVAVVDARKFYAQSFSFNDVLNRVPGVRIRQEGGLGSNATVSINGIGGKQVKFFLDGIPLALYGSGLGLNVLPVGLLERIDVYRGVTPIDLGADALGGAINVVTRKDLVNYVDASYEVSSFRTHKAALSGRYVHPKTGFFAGLNGYYSQSANNYRVRVEVPNAVGTPEPQTVRRFHDQFSSYLTRAELGWANRPWTDRFTLSAFGAGVDRELQHNVVMSQPYGQAHYAEGTVGTTATYQKNDFLTPGLAVTAYAGYTRISGHFTDTTLNAYTWDGRVYTRRSYGGEIATSGSLLTLTTHTVAGRLGLRYAVGRRGHLSANGLLTRFVRSGIDPVAGQYFGQDYAQNPTNLHKLSVGMAYEHQLLSEKLTSSTAVKLFSYRSRGYVVDDTRYRETAQQQRRGGANQLLRWQPHPNWIIKGSYEWATRLPDEYELFGDGVLVRPNPTLTAETSRNANLELRYSRPRWQVEISGFSRATENIVYLRASQFFAQYQNLLSARTRGLEADVRYVPHPALTLSVNATYQDIRNRSEPGRSGTVDDRYFNARLPNIPYLFGNAEVQFTRQNWLIPGSRWQGWWQASYVQQFYLYWEVDGLKSSKAIIPNQFVQNTGLSVSLPDNRLSISAEVHNLTNTPAYDNFSVQRPGRSFHLKLRTFLRRLPT